MRIALHSTLRPGAAADYLREHARVPDDLRALFDRAGIQDWTIWRSGDRLFHLVECDDFAAAMLALDDDPANRRWQASINGHVDHFVTDGPDPEGMVLPLVWTLTAQRAGA